MLKLDRFFGVAIARITLSPWISQLSIECRTRDEAEVYGLIRAAADAVSAIDPWVTLVLDKSKSPNYGVRLTLTAQVSCDDVMPRGPVHTARAAAVAKAMFW